MPLSPDALVGRLRHAGLQFTEVQHPPVMTVEAQEAVLATRGVQGKVLKNLFIKDKRNRFYIITALPDTKVDLQNLSARLGVGKGGLRFAPEEALQEVLHIPPGSVTPLAVSQPEVKDVVLFLDTNIQSASTVFVHPLVNTASLGFAPDALAAALREVTGKEPLFVDLEKVPRIDAQHPPDLAPHVVAPPPKAAATAAPATATAATTTAAPAAADQSVPPQRLPQPAAPVKKGGGGAKSGGKGGKAAASPDAPASSHERLQGLASVQTTTQQILDTVAKALLGGPLSSGAAATRVDAYTLQQLTADIETQLAGLKNAAYALGHVAGKQEVVAFAERRFA